MISPLPVSDSSVRCANQRYSLTVPSRQCRPFKRRRRHRGQHRCRRRVYSERTTWCYRPPTLAVRRGLRQSRERPERANRRANLPRPTSTRSSFALATISHLPPHPHTRLGPLRCRSLVVRTKFCLCVGRTVTHLLRQCARSSAGDSCSPGLTGRSHRR